MPQDFKNLNIWKEAHQLVLDIYKLSGELPADEKYALTSQLKRAIVSIELNIAEGGGKKTNKDFKSFLYQALGSTKEVENILLTLKDLNYIKITDYTHFNERIDKLGGMIHKLIQTIPDNKE